MKCHPYREAISALLDGEDPGVAPGLLQHHLQGCADCRQWGKALNGLARGERARPAEAIPDLSAAILGGAGQPWPSGHLWTWRVALVLVALAQIVPALSDLLVVAGRGTTTHLSRELGSWDVALSLGFVFVAWRPARAWGMLPLVAAVVACLLASSAVDLIVGDAEASLESVHSFPVLGLGLLWGMARSWRRPQPDPKAQPLPSMAQADVTAGARRDWSRKSPPSASARRSAA